MKNYYRSWGAKTFIMLSLLLSVFFLWGCASAPPAPPYPLDGTTWVFINKKDDNKRYTLSYTTENVTFTIFGKDGSSIDQEPIQGTYTLSGNILTEVYDDYTVTSKYSAKSITDSLDTKMVFKPQS